MPQLPTVREDAEFASDGVRCRAWLYRAALGPDGRSPIMVMAHGLGATRGMGLAAFAERFAAAGIASLVLDYRHFGASDGEPRQLISARRQRADYLAALAHARSLRWVDPARIGLWGTSFSAGHVLALGPAVPGVAAVVAQSPLTDGPASVRALGLSGVLRLAPWVVKDLAAGLLRRPPVTVPVVARPRQIGLMTAPDAWPGFISLLPADGPAPSIEVAARIGVGLGTCRPGRALRRANCPTLVAVCQRDSVAPAAATLRHAARATGAVEVRTYPFGHFDVYSGVPFETVVADQVAFLERHLLAPAG
jgi:dienelactone hydrolase